MKSGVASGIALLIPALAMGQTSNDGQSQADDNITVIELRLPNPIEPTIDESLETLTQTQSAKSVDAQANRALGFSPGERNYSQRITFAEYPLETRISDQYRERGIVFGGSAPATTDDLAVSTPPVLAGMPLFEGDITGQFVVPGTDQPATVYQFTWDIGHFDAVESVQMDFFGPQGQLLYSNKNLGEGSYRYVARGGNIGIASWRMHVVSSEPAGFGIDNIYFSIPGKDDSGREMGITECTLGNPVNPAAGNKVQLENDYRGIRAFPLAVSRTYNSLSGQWTFFPRINHQGGTIEAQVTRSDGKILTYTGGMGFASWRASSTDVTGELTSEYDDAGNIAGWRFKTLNDQVERYDSSGRLTSVSQRSGLRQSYSYDTEKILVEHSMGGSISYQLDILGRITGFTDPLGQSYQYVYGNDNTLVAVNYPGDSNGRTYHYENANNPLLLTGITDANGHRYATWTYDDSGRAISSEHSGGVERTSFDYSYINGPGTSRTTVTNALGKQTTYYYLRVNGVQRVFQVEGHPSPNCAAANQQYQFDSRAFIRSAMDWNGNVTEYLRDSKGRELIRREAVGTHLERETRTDWHPLFNLPLMITEPGRETLFDYDSSGNLTGKSIRKIDPL